MKLKNGDKVKIVSMSGKLGCETQGNFCRDCIVDEDFRKQKYTVKVVDDLWYWVTIDGVTKSKCGFPKGCIVKINEYKWEDL